LPLIEAGFSNRHRVLSKGAMDRMAGQASPRRIDAEDKAALVTNAHALLLPQRDFAVTAASPAAAAAIATAAATTTTTTTATATATASTAPITTGSATAIECVSEGECLFKLILNLNLNLNLNINLTLTLKLKLKLDFKRGFKCKFQSRFKSSSAIISIAVSARIHWANPCFYLKNADFKAKRALHAKVPFAAAWFAAPD
jgi:hypothetical protein